MGIKNLPLNSQLSDPSNPFATIFRTRVVYPEGIDEAIF